MEKDQVKLARKNNPVRADSVIRYGRITVAVLGVATCFVFPIIAMPVAVVACVLTIHHDAIEDWVGTRKERKLEKPRCLAYERHEALIQELERRSA